MFENRREEQSREMDLVGSISYPSRDGNRLTHALQNSLTDQSTFTSGVQPRARLFTQDNILGNTAVRSNRVNFYSGNDNMDDFASNYDHLSQLATL